jgi:hypothetical protein
MAQIRLWAHGRTSRASPLSNMWRSWTYSCAGTDLTSLVPLKESGLVGASPECIPLRDMWRPRNYRYAGLGLIFVHRHLVHKKWGSPIFGACCTFAEHS